MKKKVLIVCMLATALLTSACAGQVKPKTPLLGGWSSAAVTDANVVAAANFAVKAEQQALQQESGAQPATLELVAVREAAQQVVAGMNYSMKLTVMLNGKEKVAEATVWWQAWQEPDPYQLSAWVWQ